MLQFYKILLILREQNISKLVDLLHQKEMSSSEYIINTYSYILNYYTTDVLLFCSLSVSSSVQCCMTYVFRNKLWKRKKCQFLNPHCGNYGIFLSPEKKIVKTAYSVIAKRNCYLFSTKCADFTEFFQKKNGKRGNIRIFHTVVYREKTLFVFPRSSTYKKKMPLAFSREWLFSVYLAFVN